jgi:predicted nucleic acid-binding protein
MNVLLDTSIIVHSKQETSVHYAEITNRIEQLILEGHQLVICRQVLYEFYSVVTRPATANGYGFTPAEALQEIESVMQTYELLDDIVDLQIWKETISAYNVIGKRSHDARLVATMRANAINDIYTKNEADFKQFADIINLV